MKKITRLLFVFLSLLSFWACGKDKDYLITISTRHGEIKAILFDDTPEHKANFIALAEAGRFDSTQFHRVIEGFMVQGGDVFGKEGLPAEQWPTLPAEISTNHVHVKGMIAAARQGDNINPQKRSNGSQFYIVQGRTYEALELTTDFTALQKAVFQFMQLGSQQELKQEYNRLYQEEKFDSLTNLILSKRDEIAKTLNIKLTKDYTPEQIKAYAEIGGTPHLDFEYTVFGQVLSGLDVVDKIAIEPTTREVPNNPVIMTVTVEKVSKKKIEKEFGYVYPQSK
ncbi:peptidyl-prolyl cis-trans isomerase B (cyclophilin B) [Algoriphagus boseongensis]|uniref:Peptidyl-prolyl cis-trans isomerase n=1 Tax=Algoriphagus boseongensis TaxID=1442587 RepID=A0A4V6PW39_9BACT|nr:peptidylprolyl isomerase [Algoriphagus boseongensis]TDQ14979.1 peptidyl-prolyl cis-trans isomerase B (cyclophilin B) [Algoriphagus boseongensis]